MLPEYFIYIGAALSLVGTLSYLRATLKGKAKPNRVSWFLWALAPLIAFAAQIDEGVGPQSVLTFAVGLGPIIVLAASFLHKSSAWKLSLLDYVCGAFSIFGLILWQLTQEGTFAIIFSLIADMFASIPTVIKSYRAPETEEVLAYLFTAIGALMTLLTITHWNFETYAFPLYLLVLNALIYTLLIRKPGKRLSR